jgi:hypothetical protein
MDTEEAMDNHLAQTFMGETKGLSRDAVMLDDLRQIIACPNCRAGWRREARRPHDWRQCCVCEARGFLVIDGLATMGMSMLPKPASGG